MFDPPKQLEKLRGAAAQYLSKLHGLNDEQLGCLICSPFVNQADGLEPFLQKCHPDKVQRIKDFHRVLMGNPAPLQANVAWLESISGLPLASLQALYHMQKIDFTQCNSLIASLWAHDPNKQAWHTAPGIEAPD